MPFDKALLNALPYGVSISDARQPHFPLVFVNQAFEELTGYRSDEALGKSCRFLNAHNPNQPALQVIREALRSGGSCTVVVENARKDGSIFFNQLSLKPLFDEHGTLTHMIGMQVDVTGQVDIERQLREAELRFRRMIANVPGMVYQIALLPGGTFEFSYVSEGSITVCGVAPALIEADPQALFGLIVPEDLPGFGASVQQSARDLSPWIWEGRFMHPEAGLRWIRGLSRPELMPGGVVRWDGVLIDITAGKQAEEIIDAQAAAIAELSTPVIPFDEHTLVMPLIGAIDSQRAQHIIETLLAGVSNLHASTAIIDITGVSVVDTQVANALVRAAQAVKLLGAQAVLTGIRPEVAQTLVQLGVDLQAIVTRGTLQSGISYAMQRR